MSQHLSGAPNKSVMPPRVPGVMQQQQPPPSAPGSASQVVYGIPHATYNIPAAAPSMSRFTPPSATVFQTQMPNIRGGYSLVTMPSNVQRMYVPVQQMQAGHAFVRPVAVNPLVASDPTKLLEEQRRIEKERNFQMQQQRLKQFTVAGGKKGSSTAEHLLESMFGKSDSKKRSVKTSKNEGIEHERSPAQICSQGTAGATTIPPIQSSPIQSFVPVCDPVSSAKQKSKKDPKELENMMMKYSNLSGPQVPKTFQKPLVKDMPRANHNISTFIPSDKAVNWNHLSGLDNVFSSPRPRFPSWCQSGSVPQLYHDIAKHVFNEESQSLDTARLYAIFLSSGLSQKLLAEIWEMVNKSLPGSLTLEEMYAALALIAVAQAGQPIANTDILHRLPACPVPILKCFAPPQTNNPPPNTTAPIEQVATDQTGKGSVNVPPMTTTVLSSESSRPTTLASVDKVTSGVSAWKPFMGTGSKPSSMEDDFDDFKSATPMAVNIPPLSEVVPPLQDAPVDEFDEFKQADQLFDSFKSTTENFAVFPPPDEAANLDADLMSPEEDKYSIFRTLQQSNDSSGDKEDQPTGVFDNQASSSVEITKQSEISNPVEQVESEDQEDFGEFLDAKNNFASTSTNQNASSNFTANFADFNKLNSNFPSETPVAASKDAEVSKVNNDTMFGDFASFQVSAPPHDIAPDGPFRFCKDNISLAESQSVSSLEFGAFDNFGQSGDSKSSLSRQGSIPSLDLKGVGSEGADDDEFGDMQSATLSTAALGPSPLSIETTKVFNEKSPGPSVPAISAALADKYSVIRSEQVIPEDQHISDWTRCLQGCLNILQTATKIFNQMSCSSVCSEVLSTEEGKNYVKNVIEVYRVVCRISIASSSYEKQCDDLQQLIQESDQAFHTFSVFLSGSPLMPSDASLDFSPGVLKVCAENNEKACGVCLLNVDAGSRTANKNEERNKLSYGMRMYHNPCANLWVNCVDPLLPMLTLPQLI